MQTTIPETISRASAIMVVDDIMAARRIVVRILALLRFTNVTEVSNRNEAIAKLKEKPFSLVITDLHLGEDLGTNLLAETRTNDVLKPQNIPFIVMTSDMDKESFKSALQSGVTSYLLKPFSPDLLAERITTVLTKKRPS